VWKRKVSVACLGVCGTLGLPSATSAQDPGVHFDSGGPAGKEYAIPLAEGRAEGAGTTNQRAAAGTPFGVGITPPGSGGGSGGGGGGGDGAAGSGGTGGDGQRGGIGGAKGSGAGTGEATTGADGRGSRPRAIDKSELSDAEASVDTTPRTLGVPFGVLVAAILLALVLWWRREQPAT
jgi:hypothetical protein